MSLFASAARNIDCSEGVTSVQRSSKGKAVCDLDLEINEIAEREVLSELVSCLGARWSVARRDDVWFGCVVVDGEALATASGRDFLAAISALLASLLTRLESAAT